MPQIFVPRAYPMPSIREDKNLLVGVGTREALAPNKSVLFEHTFGPFHNRKRSVFLVKVGLCEPTTLPVNELHRFCRVVITRV